jgi:hypothetical protein
MLRLVGICINVLDTEQTDRKQDATILEYSDKWQRTLNVTGCHITSHILLDNVID